MTRRSTPAERNRLAHVERAMFGRSRGTPARRPVIAERMLGGGQSAGLTGTFSMMRRAPADFDALQIVLRGTARSATNQIKASVALPAQRGNGYVALDSAGAALAKTPFTFGTADREDFRNPGGGAAYAILNNGSGDGSTFDLVENDVASDWLFLRSADRSDIVGAPPLVLLNVYGNAPPANSWAESQSTSPNPITQVDPDFYSGYWQNADHTGVADPGAAPTQWGMPIVEIRYLLRGGRTGYTVGIAGDSIDQGWISASAVPQFGANLNGWGRRLVAMLNAAGVPTGLLDMSFFGQKSRMFHERAYNAVLGRHVTHLFFKPWSINEGGDGAASINPALTRTARLIELCRAKGVVPIVVHPWGGQGLETLPWAADPINSFMANVAASGVQVLDIRGAMNAGGALTGPLRNEFRTVNSGGAFVDAIHPNELGQQTAAREAFACRAQFGLL